MMLYSNPSGSTNSVDTTFFIVPHKDSFLRIAFAEKHLTAIEKINQEELPNSKGDLYYLSCSPQFHLLPKFSDDLLNQDSANELFNWDKENESFNEPVPHLDLSIHYQETQKNKGLINHLVPSISWSHISKFLLSTRLDNELSALIFDSNLYVTVFKGGKLQLCNQYQVSSSEEILYYVMLLFQELDLSQEEMPVSLYGDLEGKSDIEKLLANYVRNVSNSVSDKIEDRSIGGLVALIGKLL